MPGPVLVGLRPGIDADVTLADCSGVARASAAFFLGGAAPERVDVGGLPREGDPAGVGPAGLLVEILRIVGEGGVVSWLHLRPVSVLGGG
jgi:hypothetical protein